MGKQIENVNVSAIKHLVARFNDWYQADPKHRTFALVAYDYGDDSKVAKCVSLVGDKNLIQFTLVDALGESERLKATIEFASAVASRPLAAVLSKAALASVWQDDRELVDAVSGYTRETLRKDHGEAAVLLFDMLMEDAEALYCKIHGKARADTPRTPKIEDFLNLGTDGADS